MEKLGRTLWIIAELMWITTVIRSLVFNSDKIYAIWALGMVIGLMLISNRMIDDAKTKKS